MKDFLTKKQAAKLLNRHPVTINRYCEQEKLTYYQIGSRKMFLHEDIEKFLEESKHNAKTNSQNPFDVD